MSLTARQKVLIASGVGIVGIGVMSVALLLAYRVVASFGYSPRREPPTAITAMVDATLTPSGADRPSERWASDRTNVKFNRHDKEWLVFNTDREAEPGTLFERFEIWISFSPDRVRSAARGWWETDSDLMPDSDAAQICGTVIVSMDHSPERDERCVVEYDLDAKRHKPPGFLLGNNSPVHFRGKFVFGASDLVSAR
jgi:hypothetical protein